MPHSDLIGWRAHSRIYLPVSVCKCHHFCAVDLASHPLHRISGRIPCLPKTVRTQRLYADLGRHALLDAWVNEPVLRTAMCLEHDGACLHRQGWALVEGCAPLEHCGWTLPSQASFPAGLHLKAGLYPSFACAAPWSEVVTAKLLKRSPEKQ